MGTLGVALAGVPRFDGDEGHLYPSSTSHHLSVPGPCRHCGGPSWLRDDIGTVHPCCELNGPGECRSCRTSEQLNREQRQRKSKPWKEVKAEGVDG